MQVWDTDLKLNLSLQVAGQVTTLDSWEGYIAVGSEVIQLIQLNSNLCGDPRRILYVRREDPIKVYTVTTLKKQNCYFNTVALSSQLQK